MNYAMNHKTANTITINADGIPILKRTRKKGQWVTQPCLFCGKKHGHGSGEGHRVAHCIDTGKLLRIVLPDGRVVSHDRGYYLVNVQD